jgi:hypothetical protein
MPTTGEPQDTREAIIRTLEERTGLPLNDWVELVQGEGIDTAGAAMTWLEIEHGIGRHQAEIIAEEAFGTGGARESDTPEIKLDAQYADQKAELKPLRDALANAILGLGDDVSITTHLSHETVTRARDFAVITPVARPAPGRVLLGLSLPGTEYSGRPKEVTETGINKNITHEIALKNEMEIDDDLLMWLSKAYNHAG